MFALGRFPIRKDLSNYIKQQTNKSIEKKNLKTCLVNDGIICTPIPNNYTTFLLFSFISFFLGYNYCLIKNTHLMKN
jgi:hypothetical protein